MSFTPPGLTVATGSTVTWAYTVTNTGNVALSNVSVTDNKIGAIACPAATPSAVAMPARRRPSSVLRMVRAVSCPGVQITSSDTPRNAR